MLCLGYDKLLVPDREFVRMGCLYKHSTRGLQQRMLFLVSIHIIYQSTFQKRKIFIKLILDTSKKVNFLRKEDIYFKNIDMFFIYF